MIDYMFVGGFVLSLAVTAYMLKLAYVCYKEIMKKDSYPVASGCLNFFLAMTASSIMVIFSSYLEYSNSLYQIGLPVLINDQAHNIVYTAAIFVGSAHAIALVACLACDDRDEQMPRWVDVACALLSKLGL